MNDLGELLLACMFMGELRLEDFFSGVGLFFVNYFDELLKNILDDLLKVIRLVDEDGDFFFPNYSAHPPHVGHPKWW